MSNIVNEDTIPVNNSSRNVDTDPDLADPDASGRLDHIDGSSAVGQADLAAHIVGNETVLTHAVKILEPRAFTTFAHKAAVEFAFKYHKKYGKVPSKAIIIEALNAEHKHRKDWKTQLNILAKLEKTPADDGEYWIDRINNMSISDAIKKAENVWIKGDGKKIKPKDIPEYYRAIDSARDKCQLSNQKSKREWFSDEDVDSFESPVWQVQDNWHCGELVLCHLEVCLPSGFRDHSTMK